jgi:hypothetical protein
VSKGRQLVTLRDAAVYIQKLPEAEQLLEEWQAAVEALLLVVELSGPTMMAALRKRLTPLIRKTPYAKKIAHKAIWVEPELLAEIEYRAKSAEGKVRHPFFKGIRDGG